jgi:hypothetical protein
VLFKAEDRMSDEEKETLAELMDAESHVGKLRAFLGGVPLQLSASAGELGGL